MNEDLDVEALALALFTRYGHGRSWTGLTETQRDRWRQDAIDVRAFYADRLTAADIHRW